MASLIVSALVAGELRGIRISSFEAECTPVAPKDDLRLSVNTKSDLKRVQPEGKVTGTIAVVSVHVSVTVESDGNKNHKLFDIEVQGGYRWKSVLDDAVLADSRLVCLLARPLFSVAVVELRKFSSSMDMGEFRLQPNLPWPDGMPLDLEDDVSHPGDEPEGLLSQTQKRKAVRKKDQ